MHSTMNSTQSTMNSTSPLHEQAAAVAGSGVMAAALVEVVTLTKAEEKAPAEAGAEPSRRRRRTSKQAPAITPEQV